MGGGRIGTGLVGGRKEKEREIGLGERKRRKGILGWGEKKRGRRGKEVKLEECLPPQGSGGSQLVLS